MINENTQDKYKNIKFLTFDDDNYWKEDSGQMTSIGNAEIPFKFEIFSYLLNKFLNFLESSSLNTLSLLSGLINVICGKPKGNKTFNGSQNCTK